MQIVRSLSFYPVVFVGALFLFVIRALGWSCLVGFLLIGAFRLAGALEVSWWIVASVGAAAVLALAIADVFTELLAGLKLVSRER